MNPTPQVKYCSINRVVSVESPTDSLLDLSIQHKIPHLHECGGSGKCTTCRVRILDGLEHLPPRNRIEAEAARNRHWDPSIRLACQTHITQDVSLQRLVWTSSEVSQLQTEMVSDEIGEERPLAILFCDMRNFTELAALHPAFDLMHMLNRFFTSLGDPILMNNGIIYQYVGDEITGLFGTAGGDPAKACLDAVRAGLGMLYAVERLNRIELKDFGVACKIGVGIHFGSAVVGHIGHPRHRQFAVVGDPVNVASRIQSRNKKLGTKLLVSAELLKHIPENTLKLGIHSNELLKGKKELHPVVEIKRFAEPDIHLEVQATLDVLLQNEEQFAATFYHKVFTAAPQVRSLFKSSMLEQGRMLTHMLGGIVYSLSRPEHLVLGLRKLGKQHEKYGVLHAHYPVVREALLDTIEEELGDAYTPATRTAWEKAIDTVIEIMRSGTGCPH